jgi:hypothetical protein
MGITMYVREGTMGKTGEYLDVPNELILEYSYHIICISHALFSFLS